MRRFTDYLRNTGPASLAVVVLVLVPAALEASGIGFRNDTNQTIHVQGSLVVNGQVKQRGSLLRIKPGETAWDLNLPKCVRTITVYDGSNRVLFQGAIPFDGMNDLFFAVQPVAVPANQPPRVKLKELPVPVGGQ